MGNVKATVTVQLDPLAVPGLWVGGHASMTSEVIDGNITGKTIESIQIRVFAGSGTRGQLEVKLNDNRIMDPVGTLRAIGKAIATQADQLEQLTIGMSDDEKTAIESIAKAHREA